MCKKPNEKTIKAIEELEQGLGKSVDNIDELFKDLENDIKKAERKGENTMLTSKEEEELREFQLEKLAEDAYSAGHNDGYEKGYEEGYEEGKDQGYDNGREEGEEAGFNNAKEVFDETPINELVELLKKQVESSPYLLEKLQDELEFQFNMKLVK